MVANQYPFAVGRLPAAKLNEILTANHSRVGVRARRVATQLVNNASVTPISFDTQDEDTDSMFAPTSTTITIPFPGIYVITFVVATTNVASARNFLAIAPTSSIVGTTPVRANWTTGEDQASVSATYAFAANDTFVCSAFHSMGSAQNFTAGVQCWRMNGG